MNGPNKYIINHQKIIDKITPSMGTVLKDVAILSKFVLNKYLSATSYSYKCLIPTCDVIWGITFCSCNFILLAIEWDKTELTTELCTAEVRKGSRKTNSQNLGMIYRNGNIGMSST